MRKTRMVGYPVCGLIRLTETQRRDTHEDHCFCEKDVGDGGYVFHRR